MVCAGGVDVFVDAVGGEMLEAGGILNITIVPTVVMTISGGMTRHPVSQLGRAGSCGGFRRRRGDSSNSGQHSFGQECFSERALLGSACKS